MVEEQTIRGRGRAANLLHALLDDTGLHEEHIAFPRSMLLQMSDACNLDCVYCARQVHDRVKNGLMSYEILEKHVGPYLHLADMVQLYGTGEPMLHPQFVKMVELCKSKGAQVMTTSNATLITPERADRLVEIGLDLMLVSMDGCTPDTFAKLRGGADLEKIKANVQLLNAAKRKYGVERPMLELACVVSRTNVHQLCGMVRLARELGCLTIRFYNVVIHRPEHAHEDVSGTWRFRWGMHRAKRLAERYGMGFVYTYQNPFPEERRVLHPPGQGVPKRCVYSIHSPIVSKTGEVYPCCLSHYSYGKLGQDGTLWEILNSERAREFRRGMLTGDYHPDCAQCGLLSDWGAQESAEQISRAEKAIHADATLSEAERLSLLTRVSAERRRLEEFVATLPSSSRTSAA